MCDSDRVGGRLPGPTLHRLIGQKRYTDSLEHFRERPQDAKYRDGTGGNALAVMCSEFDCSEDLLRLVEEVLDVFPFLVEQRNNYGYTPMHRAACYMKKDGPFEQLAERRLLLLIQACPKGVSTPISRHDHAKTPFHCACERNASLDLLKRMLAIDSSLATSPQETLSYASTTDYPLFMLWGAMGGAQSPGEWPKMELLLRAATGASLEEITDEEEDHDRNYEQNQPDRFDILRAACMVNPCPRDFTEILLQRYPNRLSWADERGLLPLHHAILSADKERPRHTEFLLEAMLARYSDAASHPFGKHDNNDTIADKGRSPLLPLHVLILDSEMTWHQGGVNDLTFAYPDALKIPDPRHRLVPALASAPLAIQSRQHLSTTYELLRLTPEIFQDCLANQDDDVKTDEWPFH